MIIDRPKKCDLCDKPFKKHTTIVAIPDGKGTDKIAFFICLTCSKRLAIKGRIIIRDEGSR